MENRPQPAISSAVNSLSRPPVRPISDPFAAALAWLARSCCLGLMLLPHSASATTWYVRMDGGDARECTGRHDAPYPGSGDGLACAWKHPYVALPPGQTPRIAGGDTLQVASGSYMMGIGAPDTFECTAETSRFCHMPSIPSGPSRDRPTRLLGAGHDSGCLTPPELWGSERAELVLNLQGSSNVEIACLEVTDHAACIEHHCLSGNCRGEVAACRKDGIPFGPWAYVGLSAHDSSDVTLRDLNIHGMAAVGVRAGRLNNWTTERLTLRANGWAGWDGDLGEGDSANAGYMVFRAANISWNGCAERYPSDEIFGCWASHAGGYGDGIGTAETGGHWLFEDSIINHNTSDGLDLLYLRDDASVSILRSWFEGNAGNQLKTVGRTRIENSVVVGSCGYFEQHPNMQGNDHCRAFGNALSIGMLADTTVDLVNNTIISEGDCLVVTSGGGSNARLNIVNNLLIGEPDWAQPYQRSCLMYSDGGERIHWAGNFITGVKNDDCPAGSLCGASAPIVNADLAAFDPTPLPGSPLIDAASRIRAPATDYFNLKRTIGGGPDIGSIEFGGMPDMTPPFTLRRIAAVTTKTDPEGARIHHRGSVLVVDADGMAMPAVAVHGKWRNAGVRAVSAATDADGIAALDGGLSDDSSPAQLCVVLTHHLDQREVCSIQGGSFRKPMPKTGAALLRIAQGQAVSESD